MKKELGFIGLGRMGLNMATRLVEQGYRVVGMDTNETVRNEAKEVGVEVVDSYDELVMALESTRLVWVMVPSKFVDEVLEELTTKSQPGDTIVDGGNSFYQDSLRRHQTLSKKEFHFLDCGTSGGVTGARHGASLMIGGDLEIFTTHEHIFVALSTPQGYARVGNAGAGHFTKMIHNGIEYGMMGAIAEGVAVLHEHREQLGIDIKETFKPYEHGSIISGKLISWLSEAYKQEQLDLIKGEVPVGETESEMEHVTTIGDVKVLEAALAQRRATRTSPSYVGKLISAMRNQFGGHKVIERE